jgi:hypothetical protein
VPIHVPEKHATRGNNGMNETITKVKAWLQQARDTNHFGSLTIKVRDGQCVLIETTTQLKPSNEESLGPCKKNR